MLLPELLLSSLLPEQVQRLRTVGGIENHNQCAGLGFIANETLISLTIPACGDGTSIEAFRLLR